MHSVATSTAPGLPMADGSTDGADAPLVARLRASAPILFGDGASIDSVTIMDDGHAGLTFGVGVTEAGGATDYILKMGPAGVRRSGSTDIFRQVRLLDVLKAGGLAVPAIRVASPDDDLLGAPFIVMEKLAGRTFIVWEPHPAFLDHPAHIAGLWTQAAGLLATLHRFDWRASLNDWQAQASIAEEHARWAALLKHCEDPEWLRLAARLGDLLNDTLPATARIGLVHGDFQPGNLLYDNGVVRGIVDWDLAMLGPQGIDLGWLMMMADRDAWADGWKPVSPLGPGDVVDAYAAAGGPALADAAWYQAFAHFRMGAIAGLNLKLHRNGRRVDPTWEKFAPSIPVLLRRGIDLLQPLHPSRNRP